MAETRFRLRDLPGVAELEARLAKIDAHPNPEWAPENDNLLDDTQRLCERLFGITLLDTWFDYDALRFDEKWEYDEDEIERQAAEWEQNFNFLDAENDADRELIWSAMGWDVSDGQGEDLGCLGYFERAIVCAAKGLRGRLPGAPLTDEELAEQEPDIEAKLRAEAAGFARRRKP